MTGRCTSHLLCQRRLGCYQFLWEPNGSSACESNLIQCGNVNWQNLRGAIALENQLAAQSPLLPLSDRRSFDETEAAALTRSGCEFPSLPENDKSLPVGVAGNDDLCCDITSLALLSIRLAFPCSIRDLPSMSLVLCQWTMVVRKLR
jgi:hypothetical protein